MVEGLRTSLAAVLTSTALDFQTIAQCFSGLRGKYIGMQKIWKVLLLFVLLLFSAKHTLAQENEDAQREAVRKLQEKLDELKTQMKAVQAELDGLRATNPPAHGAKNNQPVSGPPRTGTIEN